jgi:hypothetical protein
MKRLRYTRAHKLNLLHDQLLAAGIALAGSPETTGPDAFMIPVQDDVADSVVEAIINAHDPSQPSVAEQIEQERNQASAALRTQYQQAMTRLTDIVQDGSTYTAAQQRDAIVDLARGQRALLALVKNAIT